MEEQNAQNQIQPAAAPAPEKKSYVWFWVIGGCLMITILIFGAIMAVGWWGAKKIKKEIKENQPRIEQWKKEAEKMQKNAEKFQEEMNKIQNNIPSQIPADNSANVPETDENEGSL